MDEDRFKRHTQIKDGMCEHGCCDWCPQGCFDNAESAIDKAAEGLSRHMLVSKIEARLAILKVLQK